MDESRPRRDPANDNRELPKGLAGLTDRPDRLALWAVLLAVVAMIAGAASADAGSGGLSSGPSGGASPGGGGGSAATDDGRRMVRQLATWYGPGFFGNRTACGQRLTRRTVGVAHRNLPCGSKVVIRYKGSYLRTRVIDRGPYANRAKWDLTKAAARKLRFRYTDKIRVARLGRR